MIHLPFSREDFGRFWFKLGFVAKKNFTKFYRSHMSHFLAVILAGLAVGREVYEHLGKIPSIYDMNLWLVFVFGVAAATVLAAVWELIGNRLATSQQEVRFIIGTHTLLKAYNIYERRLTKAESELECETLLEGFLSELLKASSGIICGKNRVDASVMLENKKQNSLVLQRDKFYRSERAKKLYDTPETFSIPLGVNTGEDVGPAETAFNQKIYIAHMPNKRKKRGMLILQDSEEDYDPKGDFKGWFPSEDGAYEDFRSVLSLPLTSYRDDETNDIFGVLSYTIRGTDQLIKRDLFIDRDYIMASCFSILVAMAIAENKNKIKELTEASNETDAT